MPECPVCGSSSAPRRIGKCSSCGHRWLQLSAAQQRRFEQSIYSDDYYRDDPVLSDSFDQLLTRDILPRLSGRSVLDVGCGDGAFLAAGRRHGLQVEGIDISPASEARCRSRGLPAVAGDYRTYGFNGRFDAVTMWDVIEHLPSPRLFLARTRELLNPGGLLIAKVPMFGRLSVMLSAAFPCAAGALLGAPGHLQYFTRSTLGRTIESEGFAIEWLQPPRHMRSRPEGGSARKRVVRSMLPAYRSLAGDSNLYVAATAR